MTAKRRAPRGSPEGFAEAHEYFIAGSNLTSTKARMLLMASSSSIAAITMLKGGAERRALFAPPRWPHTHARFESNSKRRFQSACQCAAVAGKDASADTGIVRQLRYAGNAAARGDATLQKVGVALLRSVAEHQHRSDGAERPER